VGLLNKIASFLSRNTEREGRVFRTTVRCSRCGEKIPVRIDLSRELTPQYGEGEGAYYVRKGVIGSGENRCFQRIDVYLTFDAQKRLVARDISGGEFVDNEDVAGR
jgi:hypothetical protein